MKPVLSIIIPVLSEQDIINTTLSDLYSLDGIDRAEVIVVDGDPTGSTLSAITRKAVRKIKSSPGRGIQMNTGASFAKGRIFLFLHADTRLPSKALHRIIEFPFLGNIAGGAFDLGIDAKGLAFRMIEKTASVRSRLTRIPFGDQSLFIDKNWFFRIGGFKPICIMEDVDLMRRLKQNGGKIRIFKDMVSTSARRWHKDGILKRTFGNWLMLFAYYGGIKPKTLSRYY